MDQALLRNILDSLDDLQSRMQKLEKEVSDARTSLSGRTQDTLDQRIDMEVTRLNSKITDLALSMRDEGLGGLP